MGDIEKIAEQALENAIKKMAREMVFKHPGCGIDSEVKELIKDQTKQMFKEDEELKVMLKERIIYWIGKQ